MEIILTLEEVEHELYVLINSIEYYGHRYEDHIDYIIELEDKIKMLKNLNNF